MFSKISRSWTLAGQCWDVLEDPALLIFPLLSSFAMLIMVASFLAPLWVGHHGLAPDPIAVPTKHVERALFYAEIYCFYVASYTIVMFFNAALIFVAIQRLDGERATVGDGFRAAASNLPSIIGYALIAATVGTILRLIEQRSGIVGRIVAGLLGAAWTLATAMTLPVLIVENVGPIDAISRSSELLRSNWGENLIGNAGISIGIAVIAIPLCLMAMGFMRLGAGPAGLVLLIIVAIGLSLVSATLHSIYTGALYRFATGSKGGGIDQDLLAEAFLQK